jgi:hypothetical protein
MSERVCRECGRRFVPRTGTHRFCTAVCRERARLKVRPPRERARYGAAHRRLRASLAATVQFGLAACVRCGQVIEPGAAWDLDHDDAGGYLGPAHAGCNRAAGGRAGWEPGAAPEDDPELGIYWGPPDPVTREYRRWSRPWHDWRSETPAA